MKNPDALPTGSANGTPTKTKSTPKKAAPRKSSPKKSNGRRARNATSADDGDSDGSEKNWEALDASDSDRPVKKPKRSLKTKKEPEPKAVEETGAEEGADGEEESLIAEIEPSEGKATAA